MKAVKNVFILIGLFLLSQVGMTAFSVVKIYYLEAGEPTIPAMIKLWVDCLAFGKHWSTDVFG